MYIDWDTDLFWTGYLCSELGCGYSKEPCLQQSAQILSTGGILQTMKLSILMATRRAMDVAGRQTDL